MSNYDNGIRIWIRDLDAYITIDNTDEASTAKEEVELLEREEKLVILENELNGIGEILLLEGKSTSARNLHSEDVLLSEWRWAVHQAEHSLHAYHHWADLEPL